VRKPEEAIYKLTLDVTQQAPEQCCFIDDRALNLEVAKRLGMHTVEMHGAEQLRSELKKIGVQ
jgi:putative hydrolase of the HAD superfamily